MNTPTTRAAGIGHVHLHVRELDRSVAFYTRLLGLRTTETIARRLAFLSAGERHHDLALQAIGAQAPPAPHGTPGLYHTAFEAAGAAEFLELWRRVREEEIPHGAVDHGISWALYFDDPDGNGVEIYTDRRAVGGATWSGRSRVLTFEQVADEAQRSVPHNVEA